MTQFMGGGRSVCCLAVLLVDGVGVGSDFSGCLRYSVVLWFFVLSFVVGLRLHLLLVLPVMLFCFW